MIPAHDSPLAALAFSPTGLRIATASEKGTVIRVFSVSDGTKLYEFRRGVKRCVSISSLSFSMCSQYLCCSSNTETVHVFKLEEPKETYVQSINFYRFNLPIHTCAIYLIPLYNIVETVKYVVIL